MNVNITTQFAVKLKLLVLRSTCNRLLKILFNAPIDITVSSTEGVQSFLSRDNGAKKFTFTSSIVIN